MLIIRSSSKSRTMDGVVGSAPFGCFSCPAFCPSLCFLFSFSGSPRTETLFKQLPGCSRDQLLSNHLLAQNLGARFSWFTLGVTDRDVGSDMFQPDFIVPAQRSDAVVGARKQFCCGSARILLAGSRSARWRGQTRASSFFREGRCSRTVEFAFPM